MRKAKEFECFSCKMDKDISKMLTEITEETRLSKTAVVEKAIKTYYDNFKKTGKI